MVRFEMSECLKLLKDLVAIPSVNPVYGGPGEREVENFVGDFLSSNGIEYQVQETLPGRNNLVARIGPPDLPAVLVEAHMDTVGVAGWLDGSPYELIEKEGKFFGRGACDTKASLAVFMLLAQRLAQAETSMKHALVFAASVDEESKQLGAFKLTEWIADLNIVAAITGEPTRSDLITKHKGACRYTIEARGKAAHGSTPELGENAIYKIARIVEKLDRYADLLSNEEGRVFIEKGSLNVGKVTGGIGFNIVPGSCVIDVDRRLGITETMQAAREAIDTIAQTEVEVEVSTFLERPALNTDNANWFPQALAESAEKVGVQSEFREVAFMTNGVAYSAQGVPTVVFGPGDIEQAHKADEYIDGGEMERSLKLLERFFLS